MRAIEYKWLLFYVYYADGWRTSAVEYPSFKINESSRLTQIERAEETRWKEKGYAIGENHKILHFYRRSYCYLSLPQDFIVT